MRPDLMTMLATLFRIQSVLRLAWLSVLLISVVSSSAAPAQYRIDVWTTENGLPQNTITSMLQTRDGYLWLGTFGGLTRFDGVRFTVFDVGNTKGLKSNRILGLCEDRAGNLWIGTERGGLARYREGNFTTYTTKDGLPIDTVSYICEDRARRLWLGTSEGLVQFDGGRFIVYTTKDGMPSNAVSRITEDRRGDLWFGTRSGLVRLSGGRFTTYTTRDGLPENYVRTVYEGRDGGLWVGTNSGGVARFSGGRAATYTTADGLSHNGVRSIVEDRTGNLWIGTWSGLNRLSFGEASAQTSLGGMITVFAKEYGLSDNTVDCLLADREGNIWVGTNTAGLNRLRARKLAAYGKEEGLPADGVVPITEDAAGDIWIGTTCGGLARFRAGVFTTYGAKDGLPNECVWSLLADRAGNLWIGTWGGGLTRFREGKFTTYTSSNSGLPANAVLALFEDHTGTLWVGTGTGLTRFQDGAFTVYRQQDGLVYDDVRFITEDREGALWVGTTGGVSRFKDGRFTNYTTDNGLSHNFVREIHETADGTFWFGTYGGGLNRFKHGRFAQITTRQGLFENIVSRILEDERGNFWMSGNKGIFRASRKELDDLADGKTTSIICVSYGVADGMKSNECNGGGQPAGWKTRAGQLWFPTAKGVAVVDLQSIGFNELPPPVAIEQVLVNQSAVDALSEISVPPGAGELEIHYTGLSLIASEQVRFRYQLAGLDNNWVEAGTRRAAYYSHLPPGKYSFAVIAANIDGVWNREGARLRVVVIPPFWRTWWFLSLALAGLAGLVWLAYQRRIAVLERRQAAQEAFSRRLIESQEQERKRIAAELHDGLGQSLIIIKNRALVGLTSPEELTRAVEQLNEISAATSQAIAEMKEIAYNLRPYQLDRLGLTKALEGLFNKVANSSAIKFSVEIDDLDGLLQKDEEINLYRIVQEGVNNIIKHSQATEAKIIVKREAHSLLVMIADNGRGFSPESEAASEVQRGFGLTGITERARILGGRPVIQSAPGKGTTISLRLEPQDGDYGH